MSDFLLAMLNDSMDYLLLLVLLVSFFESLALVGLVLPGVLIMTALGVAIGNGQLSFYAAWGVGIIGCLAGDWLSYYIGHFFKHPLKRWSFMQKNRPLLEKTAYALHRHSMPTIIIGRFVGPTRPLVPMVAGILDLPLRKFLPADLIGCLFWPPVYFFPGILTGVALEIPAHESSHFFKWWLLLVILLVWGAIWLTWRSWRLARNPANKSVFSLQLKPLLLLMMAVWLATGIAAIILWQHPLMPLYSHLVSQVLKIG